MEQLVRVKSCGTDGTADVICIRESACSGDCHKCSGCGAAQETIVFTAINSIGARPGDLVYVRSGSGPVLMGAAVLYMMPLVLFFLGYFAADALWGLGALGGCAAFVLGICGVVLYDRLIAKKQNTVYTIVGYARKPNI
jgi:sigma-E factor negative regulatory protein RseC